MIPKPKNVRKPLVNFIFYNNFSNDGTTENVPNIGIASKIVSLVSSVIMTLCNIMLFQGCYKRKRFLFLPWLILNMISIVISYLLVLILIGSGIAALVVSDKVDDQQIISNEGEMYDGSNFAIIGGLVGMSAIIYGIIVLVATSKIIF